MQCIQQQAANPKPNPKPNPDPNPNPSPNPNPNQAAPKPVAMLSASLMKRKGNVSDSEEDDDY